MKIEREGPRRGQYYTEFRQYEIVRDWGGGIKTIEYYNDETKEFVQGVVSQDGYINSAMFTDLDELHEEARSRTSTATTDTGRSESGLWE